MACVVVGDGAIAAETDCGALVMIEVVVVVLLAKLVGFQAKFQVSGSFTRMQIM